MDATCKTCPFFASYLGAADDTRLGTCRRAPPIPMMSASGGDHPELGSENPEVSSAWWCSEHPLRQRDRLAAMAMQALIPAEVAMPDVDMLRLAASAYAAADGMLMWRAGTARAPVSPGKDGGK